MKDRQGRDLDPHWSQTNIANGGTVYATMGGDIILHDNGSDSRPAPASSGDRSPHDRIRILMVAANPSTTPRLALDEEAREIGEKLRLAQDRDAFELITHWAVRPADLLQYLNQYRPSIVHFSGHGSGTGEIVLSTGHQGDHRVSAAALAELFRIMKDDIRIVVLNACYSAIQAQAIGQHIDYIIGMRAPIEDQAAIVFAAAFYSALGFRRTIQEAFDQATTALMLHGMPDHDIPELIVRPGADPHFRKGRIG